MSAGIAFRVYDLYGRFYDGFEMLFKRRLARALAAVPFHPGDRVLDIGTGTGLALEYFPPDVHVTGLDLSMGMLRQAQRKLDAGLVRGECPRSETQLVQGDALNLPFGEKAFDVVLLSHVITTVPDPQRCLAEAIRVVREHGLVVMVNHFRTPYPVLNWVESAIDPVCRKLGWRSDLSMMELLGQAGVENMEQAREAPGVLFRILYLQKKGEGVRVVSLPAPVEREAKFGAA